MKDKQKELARKARYREKHRDRINEEARVKNRNSGGRTLQRRKYRLTVYGLSSKEYTKLKRLQKNKCAICRNPETIVARDGKIFPLCVDHCHITGKVRGLLCRKCNSAIGLLGDKAATVFRAFEYLSR